MLVVCFEWCVCPIVDDDFCHGVEGTSGAIGELM